MTRILPPHIFLYYLKVISVYILFLKKKNLEMRRLIGFIARGKRYQSTNEKLMEKMEKLRKERNEKRFGISKLTPKISDKSMKWERRAIQVIN